MELGGTTETKPMRKHPNLMRPGKTLVFFILLAAAHSLAGASTPLSQYLCRTWNTRDGLPQATVQAVLQAKNGYLWLGSQEGLVRFDGVKFSVFNKKNTPSFRHNDVRALCEGRDGRLWIGTANGLLSYQNGNFSTHFFNRGSNSDFVSVLCEDPQGALWIGTYGGGLILLQQNRAFTSYTTREGLSADVVTAVFRDRDGIVWIGTANGLNRMQDDRISVWTKKDGLPSDFITAIRETSDGSLWIGTRAGVVRTKGDGYRTYTTEDGLTGDEITCLYEDGTGGIWIGTEKKGLSVFSGGTFSRFTTKEGLSDDYVLSVCQDREGLIWVGTYGNGLNRLWKGKFATLTVQDGLPSKEVRTILGSRDGSVWVGTLNGGLARLRKGSVTTFSTRDGLPDNAIRALFEDAAGLLWVGTNNGLACLKDGRFVNYSRKDGLAHDYIRCITQDRAGRLWIGTSGGGVHLYRDGRFINYRDKGIPENVIRALTPGRDGCLWIGSNDGLTRWQNGETTHYSAQHGLPKEPIYVVLEDEDRVLWLGTYGGGLCRFKNGSFTRYTIRDGLFDDVVYQILEDDRGNLWMSCNLGIFRAEKKSLDRFAEGTADRIRSFSYGTADGMRSSECNGNAQPAGAKTGDGRVWFPTTEGLVVISPDIIPKNLLPPLVAFERILVNGRVLCPASRAVVPPGPGSLEFHFAGLSFIAPEKMKFKYRLEGYDQEWIDAGERRSAFYTNMSPGSYRFSAIACNNDGFWNEKGVSFEFTLKPYFRQSKAFAVLVAGILFAAGFGIYRRRVRQYRERERELNGFVEARTKDLADVNARLENANAKLEHLATHDDLTGLANRRHFMRALETEWRRSERQASPLSLIMVDADHFKAYNDNCGHQAGDRCLKTLASALAEAVTRAGDLVGRYGGEEFIILLPATGGDGAAQVAERLRERIEAERIGRKSSSADLGITISLGVATVIPKRGMRPEILIKAADRALYRAKNEGRNRWKAAEAFSPADQEAVPAPVRGTDLESASEFVH